jgi:Transmembrane family 220, helix
MFLFFASLQINDPDPIVWILIYGLMAVACVLSAFGIHSTWMMLIQALGYLIYTVLLWPSVVVWLNSPDRSLLFDDFATMQFPYIEETREFLGLIICLVVLGGIGIRFRVLRHKAG